MVWSPEAATRPVGIKSVDEVQLAAVGTVHLLTSLDARRACIFAIPETRYVTEWA